MMTYQQIFFMTLISMILDPSDSSSATLEKLTQHPQRILAANAGGRSIKTTAADFVGKGVVSAVGEMASPFLQIGQDYFLNLLGPTVWYRATTAPKNGRRVSDLIFNENVEEEIEDYQHQLLFAAANDSEMPPLLLYGPAGTGKTELAKRLTNEGSDYGVNLVVVEIHTQDLKKGRPKSTWFDYPGQNRNQNRNKFEHLLQFANRPYKRFLGQWMGRDKKKLIIFIDEGERLLAPEDSGKRTDEIEAFLSAMGSGSRHFTIILTTNNPGQIDEAVLSRFAYQVHVDAPDREKRLLLIQKYIATRTQTNNTYANIRLSDDFLDNEEKQEDFFKASEGLAGRDLKQIAYASVNKAFRNMRKSAAKGEDSAESSLITGKIIVEKVRERIAKKSEQENLAEIEEKKRLERFERDLKTSILRKMKEKDLIEKTRNEVSADKEDADN